MAAKEVSTLTEADGHDLATDMFDKMRELGMDELSIDGAADYREGRPQSDLLLRHLRVAQQHPAVEKGFLALLTDVIGAAVESSGGDDYRGLAAKAQKERDHG